MAYKLTPEQYKDVARQRISSNNTAENTNSAVSAYARVLNARRALDNKNRSAAMQNSPVIENDDEQADGNWLTRTLSTIAAPALRFVEGAAKFMENAVLDFGAGLTASVLDVFGADKAAKDVQKFAAKDIVGETFDWQPIEDIYRNSYSNEWGKFGEILQEGIYSVGNQAIPFALNFVPVVGPALSKASFAMGAYGGGFESASQDGGSVLASSAYGVISAGLEVAIENIGGAFSWSDGAGAKMDSLIKKVAGNGKSAALLKWVKDAAGEGFEEVLSGMLNNYVKAMTYNGDYSSVKEYFNNIISAEPATAEELLDQFLVGALSGGMMGGSAAIVRAASPTVRISEQIQELEGLREKGYNLNLRGKNTTEVESLIIEKENEIAQTFNKYRDTFNKKALQSNNGLAIADYMMKNYNRDQNGNFTTSKNVLIHSENASYGVAQAELDDALGTSGKLHEGAFEGDALISKQKVEKALRNINATLGKSRLKVVFADMNDAQDYGYIKNNVIVVNAAHLGSQLEFKVTENGRTTTHKADAGLSTLLHEVLHFTDDTKAGKQLRELLNRYAKEQTTDALVDTVANAFEATKNEEGFDFDGELSARQLEHLLFNENIINRLTEDNSSLSKRILNKATRLLNALKGEKLAETKGLGALLSKTVKLYNKAIAQVGKGKRIYSKGVDKEEEIEYSRRAFSFQHKNFPGEKESGSEAHRLAVWWAHRADVQTGDQTLISINNRWYLVERFDDADNHYQVEEFITKAEFEKVFKEIKAYGRSGKIKSVSGSVDFIDKLNKRGYSLEGRKSSSFGYETQYGRENNQIQQLDKKQIKRRERPTSDGNGDSSSGGANRQGDSVRYSRRITDSDGVLLSEEQAEYFKDSKVRDKNGNLLVVYHGSKSDVTTFSERFISSWNMFGRGFYFTTSERRAKGYAKGSLKECYVNLVNPFVSNNKEHLVSLYKEINNTKEDIDSYSEEKGIGGSEFFKICNYLDDIRIDVSKHIKSLGFDGVLHYGYDDIEIVAYYSNQIKLTSNQIPTKNADIRYSRRILNTEEMRQVIDDVVEMLTVIGNVDEKTFDVTVNKSALLSSYMSKINELAAKGKLTERSKVVTHLVDSIFNSTVMTEHFGDEMKESVLTLDVLRKYIHSIDLTTDSIKSEIQNEYGKNNNMFRLWSKKGGVAWDTAVQEIVEELPHLQKDSDIETLYNIFNTYTKCVADLKQVRKQVSEIIKDADEAKRLMARNLVLSLSEKGTELVTKVTADKLQTAIAEERNALRDTLRAVKNGKVEVSFAGENVSPAVKTQLQMVLDLVAKERAQAYAMKKAESVVFHLKKGVTGEDLRDLRKTTAYMELEQYVAERYLNEGKEVSIKSIEEGNPTLMFALKQVISTVQNVRLFHKANLTAINEFRTTDWDLLKRRIKELRTDDLQEERLTVLQKVLGDLSKKTSDEKNVIISYNEMISSGLLSELVHALDDFYVIENPMFSFDVTTGQFERIKDGVIAEVKAYIENLGSVEYTAMNIKEKRAFQANLSALLGVIKLAIRAERVVKTREGNVPIRKYRQQTKAIYKLYLPKHANGDLKVPKKTGPIAVVRDVGKSWLRPLSVLMIIEHCQYGEGQKIGGLTGAYIALQDALIAAVNMEQHYLSQLDNLVDGKGDYAQFKAYKKRLRQKINVIHSTGQIELTVAEALSLYKTIIQEDAKGHINLADSTAGGIQFRQANGKGYRFAKGLKFTDEQIAQLYASFNPKDVEFMNEISVLLEELGVEKSVVDILKDGVERLKDNYYPQHTAEYESDRRIGDKKTAFLDLDPVEHFSFAQRREKGKKALIIQDIVSEMQSYIKAVSMYRHLTEPLENFNIIYDNRDIDGVSCRSLIEQFSPFSDTTEYLDRLLLDIQGARRDEGRLSKFFGKIRSNHALATLSFNIKTPIVQMSAFPMLFSEMKATSVLYGVARATGIHKKENRELLYKYCPAAQARIEGTQAARAKGNFQDESKFAMVRKIGEVGMKGISLVDESTVYAAFAGFCKEFGAVGVNADNPTLLQKAGDALSLFMDGLDRFDVTSQNAISRSRNPLINVWAQWMSSYIGMFDVIVRKIAVYKQRRYELKNLPSMIALQEKEVKRLKNEMEKINFDLQNLGINESEKKVLREKLIPIERALNEATFGVEYLQNKLTTIEKDAKKAGLKLTKTLSAVSVSLMAAALLETLMRNLLSRDNEDEEQFIYDFSSNLFGNMLSLLPGVGQIYNTFDFDIGDYHKDGYEASLWFYDVYNDITKAFNGVIAIGGEAKSTAAAVRDALYAIGQLTGIPMRNFYKIADLGTKIASPSLNYRFNNIFNGSQYGRDLAKAISVGDTELADTIVRLMMKDTFGDNDTAVVKTIRSLYEQGYSYVLPKTVSSSIRINGENYSMTARQQKAFKAIYSKADATIQKLIGKQSFVKLSAKVQADSIKWIYDYYYEKAKEELSGIEDDGKKALFGKYIPIETLAVAYCTARSLEADTDKKGNVIAGTKKAKVVKYLNSIKASAAEKYMILGYLGYSPVSSSATTLITSFAQKNGASKREIAELLAECNIAA